MSKPRKETSLSSVHVSGANFRGLVGYALFEGVQEFPHIQLEQYLCNSLCGLTFLAWLDWEGKEQSPPCNRQMTNLKLIHSFDDNAPRKVVYWQRQQESPPTSPPSSSKNHRKRTVKRSSPPIWVDFHEGPGGVPCVALPGKIFPDQGAQ